MMKKFLLFSFLLMAYLVSAEPGTNPFLENEKDNAKTEEKSGSSFGVEAKDPGNPPGDVDLPIDDYVPMLVLTAMGLIGYTTYRKRNAVS